MATQFEALNAKHRASIERQYMFFTGSATAESRINISPRSAKALRIVDDSRVIYLDQTGSGNETAAHMKADGRMTIMFCNVDGPPQIMRLYGQGRIIHRDSDEFTQLLGEWFDGEAPLGARQIVSLDIEMVQTSCGYGVPRLDYQSERDGLNKWAAAKGQEGIEAWWEDHNQRSLDGLPTGIMETPR